MELSRPSPRASSHPRTAAVILGVAILAGCLLAGCSASTGRTPDSLTAPTIPGGVSIDSESTITVGVLSLPTNFNPGSPAGDNQVTQMVMEQVWPQPFVTDPSYTYESSPLIESAEVESISPLVVQYQIASGAVWSDGTPISAADFQYEWHQRLLESARLPDSGLVAGYRDVSSIVGSNGGKTVDVTFAQPFAQWQALFSALAPVQIAKRYGWSKAFQGFSPTKVVSGGPFEITSFRPGREVTLSRNPRYWGTPAEVARIQFVKEPSDTAMVRALQAGHLSIAYVDSSSLPAGILTPGSSQVVAAESSASAATSTVTPSTNSKAKSSRQGQSTPEVDWTSSAGDSLWQLAFNLNNKRLSSLELREGIEHALDRSEIVADSVDLVDASIPAAASRVLLQGEDTASASASTVPIREQPAPAYSPATARSDFESVGYFADSNGLLRSDQTGSPLTLKLLVPTGLPEIDRASSVIEAELQAAGVTVVVRTTTVQNMVSTTLPRGEFEMALAPFQMSSTYAVLAPEYTQPVLGASSADNGTSGSSTSSSAGTSGGGATSAGSGSANPSSAIASWETPVPDGSDPGAAAVSEVTRDISGFANATVTGDFAAAVGELNLPTALKDIESADTLMWSDAVSIPLFQPGMALGKMANIDNVSDSPTSVGIMWDAEDWAVIGRSRPTG